MFLSQMLSCNFEVNVTGMVRTQMFIQQRPTRTELLPQATTAGLNLSALFVVFEFFLMLYLVYSVHQWWMKL